MENQGLAPAPQTQEQFDIIETTPEPTPLAAFEPEAIEATSETEPKSENTEAPAETIDPYVGKSQPEAISETEPKSENTEAPAETANPYAGKSQPELIETLATLLETRPVQQLRAEVEAIKIIFYKEGRNKIEAEREAFVVNGGDPEAFQPTENPEEARFKELLTQYREKRNAFINQAEQRKEEAYKTKLGIIEELKELISGNETLGNTFQLFRTLQQRWKEAGIVPQEKIKDLWETYHHHVENFYNYVKINQELRDLDLRKNYEIKTELAEKAEALMLDTSATHAFAELQKLHEQWREAGPVTAEFKDTLWDRFKTASTQINKGHQDYFEGVKEEQQKNLILKTELHKKLEELAEGAYDSMKSWNEASEQVMEIQKVWKTIGFAPKKENAKIYEQFRASCDKFFTAKRTFYQGLKSETDDNLQAKIDLCIQAEALQESEDWKVATEAIIALQKQWKETGTTSRKQSEKVWKRFRAACDKFFERKTQHFGGKESQFAENLAKKQALLDEMRRIAAEKSEVTFDKIKEYQRQWTEAGFVPIKQKETIQVEYRAVVDALFGLLRGGEHERDIKSFRDRVGQIKAEGSKKLSFERDKLYSKVRQIESEIQLWENNIGFFAKSKNAEALAKEVENKIIKAKEQIASMVEKIKFIDNPSATVKSETTKPPVEVTVQVSDDNPNSGTAAAIEIEPEIASEATQKQGLAKIEPEITSELIQEQEPTEIEQA